MARPKKEQREARTERLNLRFSPDEWGEIEAKARAAGLSATEFCRLAALGCALKSRPSIARRPRLPVLHTSSRFQPRGRQSQPDRPVTEFRTGLEPRELETSLHRVNQLLDNWQGRTHEPLRCQQRKQFCRGGRLHHP